MTATVRNNVRVSGQGHKAMLFAHGFGCDQNMWRYMAPAFEDAYRVVLFDHVGAGRSDLAAYDRAKYGNLRKKKYLAVEPGSLEVGYRLFDSSPLFAIERRSGRVARSSPARCARSSSTWIAFIGST